MLEDSSPDAGEHPASASTVDDNDAIRRRTWFGAIPFYLLLHLSAAWPLCCAENARRRSGGRPGVGRRLRSAPLLRLGRPILNPLNRIGEVVVLAHARKAVGAAEEAAAAGGFVRLQESQYTRVALVARIGEERMP